MVKTHILFLIKIILINISNKIHGFNIFAEISFQNYFILNPFETCKKLQLKAEKVSFNEIWNPISFGVKIISPKRIRWMLNKITLGLYKNNLVY